MCQLCHYRKAWTGKDCIGLLQSFQLIALCLHSLHNCLNVFCHLMVLFWSGRWFTIDVLHCRGVPPPFPCGFYWYFLLSVRSVKEQFLFRPRLEFGGLSSQLSDVVVKKKRLRQKGDSFWHHHGVRYCLSSWSRELSPLFQLFNQSGKGFRGVVWFHHLDWIFLEVDFADSLVAGK